MRALHLCTILAAATCAAGHSVFVDPSHNDAHLTVCANETDTSCDAQRECQTDENYKNKTTGEPVYVCLHKELFSGFSWRDGLTGVTVFICTMLAASAGIGGGGLFTPIFIMLTGFIIQEATPLSHATVLGNSIAQLIINFPKRHPYVEGPGKPLIDYAAPLLLLPPQLAGNALGVLLNPMFPPNLLIVIAELLLCFAIYKVFTKAYKYYLEEMAGEALETVAIIAGDDGKEVVNAAKDAISDVKDVFGGAKQAINGAKQAIAKYGGTDKECEPAAPTQEEILKADSVVPVRYVLLMVAFWIIFAACFVGMKLFGTCSTGYWVLFGVLYPVVVAFVYLGSQWMKRDYANREAAGLEPVRGSLSLDPKTLIVAPTLACGVGLVAGLLGLGGGELMAPLLLELGMVPKVASATSAYMIVWTTSSDIVHYITTQDLDVQYTLFFMALALLGGLIGRHYGLVFVQKYNRQSAIAFVLGSLLVISMILFAVRAAETKQSNPWWPFKNPCEKN